MKHTEVVNLLPWERIEPGKYVATDTLGNRWMISQWASKEWRIFLNGEEQDTAPSLTDAKFSAGDDVREMLDPELHARREAARADRRARREARQA